MAMSLPLDFNVLALGLISFLVSLSFLQKFTSKKRTFSGPWGFPVLGHLPLLGEKPWKTFLQWKNKYGGIFSISLAGKKAVVIADSPTLHELYNTEDAGGAMDWEFIRTYLERRGGPGMQFQGGERWKELRNFVIKSFMEFGTRDGRFSTAIDNECQKLVNDMKQLQGKPTQVPHLFAPYMINAFSQAATNETFSHNDVKLLLKGTRALGVFESTKDLVAVMLTSFFAKFTSIIDWRLQAFDSLKPFFKSVVLPHLETRTPGQPRDLIDKFQDVVEATTDPESGFHASKETIYPLMNDLLFGAVDIPSITMEWCILYAMSHPEIQKKIQAEIASVIGHDRAPKFTDMAEMPYTEAFILEVLRSRPVVQFGVPKPARKDILVKGKIIPKDTLFVANIIGMNHDPAVWKNPEDFTPERFLATDGVIDPAIKKKICTFAPGRRPCPGERFSREALFLAVTYILQNFDLVANGPVTFDTTLGLLCCPTKPASVTFKPVK